MAGCCPDPRCATHGTVIECGVAKLSARCRNPRVYLQVLTGGRRPRRRQGEAMMNSAFFPRSVLAGCVLLLLSLVLPPAAPAQTVTAAQTAQVAAILAQFANCGTDPADCD